MTALSAVNVLSIGEFYRSVPRTVIGSQIKKVVSKLVTVESLTNSDQLLLKERNHGFAYVRAITGIYRL